MLAWRVAGSMALTRKIHSIPHYKPLRLNPVPFRLNIVGFKIVKIRNSLYFPRLLGRFLYLAVLYLPLTISFPFYYLYTIWRPHKRSLWWIKWFVWTLEVSGPTFTKVLHYLHSLGNGHLLAQTYSRGIF